MTTSSYPSYKDRDRIILLEKQVEDLQQLTSQQNLTIRRLQEESVAKSEKISSLLRSDPGKTRGYHGNISMTQQIRSIGPSQYSATPVPNKNLGKKSNLYLLW